MRNVESSADVIGIVFPVYFGKAPNIVKDFVRRLAVKNDVYIFALATYGGSSGKALKELKELLGSRGIELSAGFDIHMPQNAFYKSWENKNKLYIKSRRRVDSIAKKIENRKKGVHHSDYLLRPIVFLVYGYFEKKSIEDLEKRSRVQSPSGLTVEELLPLIDRNYEIDENCDGCGICAKICPVNNIEIKEGRPEWQNHCENCLACYNQCPKEAIHGGILSKDYHYLHPELKISDLVKQKKVRT